MNIQYQREVKVWMHFEVPMSEIVHHNTKEDKEVEVDETNVNDLLSVEKAEQNGLELWDYFDEDHLESMELSQCEETGNVWQSDGGLCGTQYELGDLLSHPEVMNDKELIEKLIRVIKTHKDV